MNINELKELLTPVFQQNKVKKAALFGSRARGDAREDSDYDFLVEFEPNAGWAYFGLPSELEEVLDKKVDTITYWSLDRQPDYFRNKVLEDARDIL